MDSMIKIKCLFFFNKSMKTFSSQHPNEHNMGPSNCSVCAPVCAHVAMWKMYLTRWHEMEAFLWHAKADCISFFFLMTQEGWGPVSLGDISPGNPGFRPSSHGAVQLESLALPDSLSTGLDDELWTVCQVVWVHFPTELHPGVQLQEESEPRLSDKCINFICFMWKIGLFEIGSMKEWNGFTVLLIAIRSADSLTCVDLVFFSTLTCMVSLASLTNRFLMATYWIPSSVTSSSWASIRPRTASWLATQQTTDLWEQFRVSFMMSMTWQHNADHPIGVDCFAGSSLTWLWTREWHSR